MDFTDKERHLRIHYAEVFAVSVHIYLGENVIGTLSMEQKGLYASFYGEMSEPGLHKLYGVFEGGMQSLGYPIPDGEKYIVNCAMPKGRLPGGALVCGRILLEHPEWKPYPGGEILGVKMPGGLQNGKLLRFPWTPETRLPAEELLCFYEYVREDEKTYLQLNLGRIPVQKE